MAMKSLTCKVSLSISQGQRRLTSLRAPPSPYDALKLGSSLILADGGKTATAPVHFFESNDPGMTQAMRMFRLPTLLRRIYTWYVRYVRRDEIYAGLLEGWHEKHVVDFWPLVAKREAYKVKWWQFWKDTGLDFVLTVPNALPAVPHGGMKDGFSSCGYTFLFNLVSTILASILEADLNLKCSSTTLRVFFL